MLVGSLKFFVGSRVDIAFQVIHSRDRERVGNTIRYSVRAAM